MKPKLLLWSIPVVLWVLLTNGRTTQVLSHNTYEGI